MVVAIDLQYTYAFRRAVSVVVAIVLQWYASHKLLYLWMSRLTWSCMLLIPRHPYVSLHLVHGTHGPYVREKPYVRETA